MAKSFPRGCPRDGRSPNSPCLVCQKLRDWKVCKCLICIHLKFMETRSLTCISKLLGRILSKCLRGLVQLFKRRISQKMPRLVRMLTCKFRISPSRVARKRGTSSPIPQHQKGSWRISNQRRGLGSVLLPSNDLSRVNMQYIIKLVRLSIKSL